MASEVTATRRATATIGKLQWQTTMIKDGNNGGKQTIKAIGFRPYRPEINRGLDF